MFYFNCMGVTCLFPCARYPLISIEPVPLLFMVEEVMRALELFDFVVRVVVADAASENRKVQRLMCTRPASEFITSGPLYVSAVCSTPQHSHIPPRTPSCRILTPILTPALTCPG